MSRPTVCAAGPLKKNSSTEIIDVSMLSRDCTLIAQTFEIAETKGRLYCVSNELVSCWLKKINIAKECCSYNVMLMPADEGVVLKTVKNISLGEPLQMWFAEEILRMLNIPILLPTNIQGKNRYICLICNKVFEYPNPLKMHIALNCNRLSKDYIWTLLADRLAALSSSSLACSLSTQQWQQTTFTFALTSPAATPPANVFSPLTTDTTYADVPPRRNSPSSLNQLSPLSSTRSNSSSSTLSSSNQPSPLNLPPLSPNPSDRLTSAESSAQHRSAFKPYVQQRKAYENRMVSCDMECLTVRSLRNMHPAEVETVVSRMGKTTDGYRCVFCNKIYTRKYGLKIHIRTHTGFKPLRCQFCKRPFGDPSNLNKHIRLHSEGNNPYRCDQCGKILVRRRDLERHMRSRHQRGNASETSSDEIDVV